MVRVVRSAGAAACSIRTVEANTGLRIDNFMSVDFQGFKGMVDALEGIEVCPEQAIYDEKARLDMEAGCQTVQGETALGYVRTRYAVGDGSDIGRIGRQQEFMEALAAKAKSKLTSPTSLYDFMQSATKSLTADEDLAGIDPLYDLASELKSIPSDRLTFLTVPNYPREADVPTDKANIVWQYPQAADLFTSLANDKEVDKKRLQAEAKNDLIYASKVRVQVLNGTGVSGRAAAVAEKLREAGLHRRGHGQRSREHRHHHGRPSGRPRQACEGPRLPAARHQGHAVRGRRRGGGDPGRRVGPRPGGAAVTGP